MSLVWSPFFEHRGFNDSRLRSIRKETSTRLLAHLRPISCLRSQPPDKS